MNVDRKTIFFITLVLALLVCVWWDWSDIPNNLFQTFLVFAAAAFHLHVSNRPWWKIYTFIFIMILVWMISAIVFSRV